MKLRPGEARVECRPSHYSIGFDWVGVVLYADMIERDYLRVRSFCQAKRMLTHRGYRIVSVPDVDERGNPVEEEK